MGEQLYRTDDRHRHVFDYSAWASNVDEAYSCLVEDCNAVLLPVVPVENVDLPFDSDGKRITWTDLAKRFDELLKKADNE